MPKYVIERDIPGIGVSSADELREAAQSSNDVLAQMQAEKKNIQWLHTYIAGEKTFCVYIADNEALIREHSERSGFPANTITKVVTTVDPVTAEP
jgi:predicted ABC-type ATPase